ncbi:MAG: DUF1385 domain-containing protein [Clostridia bacterium]|nr:DUF1385 domain-containing protein [Clostridia bacterium]
MRGPKCSAMALRMPDGSISVERKDHVSIAKKYKFLGVPIIRGVASFIDSLVFGYKCMMESAEKTSFEDLKADDGEEMSKLDRWITDHFGEKMMTALTIIASVLGVLLAVFLFMWLPAQIFTWINKAANESISNFRGLFEGIMRMIIFVGYMFLVSKMPDIKRVFMYHGAEHKSIFCFENELELTVENVRKQSRFHPRCGTSFMFVMIIFSVIVSSIVSIAIPALTKITLVWVLIKIVLILPIVMGLGFEFIKYAGTHDNRCVKILSAPGLWMQRITTVEPTDDIIEVGIASLKAALYGIENETDSDDCVVSDVSENDIEEEYPAEVTDALSEKVEDYFDEDAAVEETLEEIAEVEKAEEIAEKPAAELKDQTVDEMMEELFKETSFNDEI